jgi:hypothetical protein
MPYTLLHGFAMQVIWLLDINRRTDITAHYHFAIASRLDLKLGRRRHAQKEQKTLESAVGESANVLPSAFLPVGNSRGMLTIAVDKGT